jgi:hypothetical protein
MLRLVLALSVAFLFAAPASAVTQNVTCISSNPGCALPITVELIDLETQLEVKVTNDGKGSASIASLYFDTLTKALAQIVSVTGSPGVDFVEGFDPPNLPDGQNAGWPKQVPFGVYANGDPALVGIGAGESLSVIFDYADKALFWLSTEYDTEWRVGIYALDGDLPTSFISSVPEPGSLALLGAGGIALAAMARRRRAA